MFDDDHSDINPVRRALLAGTAAAAAAVTIGARSAAAQSASTGSAPGRRNLGGLEVSEIGMGVQNQHRTFHTIVPDRDDMIALIRTAFDHGVTFFDCAEVYGPFECERILREAIAPFRDEVQIATKFGFDINPDTGAISGVISDPDHIRRAVDGSLQRLGTDRVELLYQHRVDPDVPIEDVAGVVRDLMDAGKVLH